MRIDTLEPDFKEKVEKLIFALQEQHGIKVTVVQARRTLAEQNALFAQGRTTLGPVVTNAKGGSSPHNFGLAADLCPLKDNGDCDWRDNQPAWGIIGEVAEAMGLVWGGHFKSILDKPHVEDPDWRKVQLAWKKGEVQIA